ncbi:MAG: hypothetical protein AB7J28_02050 [Hyphomonadaceae bacterium]
MMSRRGYWVRFAVSLAVDLLDFTFGRIPIFGSVGEGLGGVLLTILWGPTGLLYFGELADVTDQIDGFIPSATLIALIVGWRDGHILRRRNPDLPAPRN